MTGEDGIELSPDATARVNQLKAQREKVEAQMTRVQDLRALSELNADVAEIDEEIKLLCERASPPAGPKPRL
jgi:hypothetical protein